MTEIIFLRHGETAGNRRKNYIGRTDEPLCAEGVAKIRELMAQGAYPAAETLLVSPLLRCRQTAELIYPDLPQLVVTGFAECDFGEFENKNWRDLADNAAYQAWIDSGGLSAFPGGESRADFVVRVERAFAAVMDDLLASADTNAQRGNVVIVAHGGTLMAILSSFGGGEYYDYMTENGAGWRVALNIELWIKERRLPSAVPLL